MLLLGMFFPTFKNLQMLLKHFKANNDMNNITYDNVVLSKSIILIMASLPIVNLLNNLLSLVNNKW